MLTKGAMPVTVATMRWTGNFSSRVKTPFGRGRRETASPTRSVQRLRRELAVLHQLEEELEEGLVRGGDDRIGTLDAIEPDGAVLSRREGVGNLGLQANHRQIRREIPPLGHHRLRELGLRLQRASLDTLFGVKRRHETSPRRRSSGS